MGTTEFERIYKLSATVSLNLIWSFWKETLQSIKPEIWSKSILTEDLKFDRDVSQLPLSSGAIWLCESGGTFWNKIIYVLSTHLNWHLNNFFLPPKLSKDSPKCWDVPFYSKLCWATEFQCCTKWNRLQMLPNKRIAGFSAEFPWISCTIYRVDSQTALVNRAWRINANWIQVKRINIDELTLALLCILRS